jgi:Fur family transcriptional regulator, ferric uptake regulator
MMERNTSQRRAIQRVMQDAGRPLSPEEILEGARAFAPGIGIATIYRALKEFTQEGWTNPVQLPGEPARYEIAGKAHHHYFYCRSCRKAFDVEKCPGDLKRLAPKGFVLENHELVLYGLCLSCKPSA